MKNIKAKIVSFLIAYFTLPIIFYAIDMICQETFYDGGVIALVPLTIILTWVMVVFFRVMCQHDRIRVSSPISAAVGGSLGLVHFFTAYIMIGSYFVWKTVPTEGMVWTMNDTLYILSRLAIPFRDYYLMYCDGALLPVILSIAFFFKIAIAEHKRQRHA